MHLPIFFDIKDRHIYIIGGGRIALRKAARLMEYQPRLTVISPSFSDGFKALIGNVRLIRDIYKAEYIDDAFMIIAATDNEDVNNEISSYCKEKKILCSRVDCVGKSDFYIPGILKRGDLQIGVSTAGKSPVMTKSILKRIDHMLGYTEAGDKLEGEIKMKIIIGTRGSKLALAQSWLVQEELKRLNPDIDFELKTIISKGDLVLDKPVDSIGGKGVFVKEIEEALLNGDIDLAIHSMKDLPTDDTDGLIIAGVPKREDYRDALILRKGLSSLADLPIGGRIGTGSKRRGMQIKKIRPDLVIVPIRGNVDTRIRKLDYSDLDGIILAVAGLKRIGLDNRITEYFSIEDMLPAPAQGALALQIRADDKWVRGILDSIIDSQATMEVSVERAFLKALGGDCNSPAGALCQLVDKELRIQGIYSLDGIELIRQGLKGPAEGGDWLGIELANRILEEINCNEG